MNPMEALGALRLIGQMVNEIEARDKQISAQASQVQALLSQVDQLKAQASTAAQEPAAA